jgi:hypothetical protein
MCVESIEFFKVDVSDSSSCDCKYSGLERGHSGKVFLGLNKVMNWGLRNRVKISWFESLLVNC